MINEQSYSESGQLGQPDVDVSATLTVAILPLIVFNVDYIGGPNIGLKSYMELVADASTHNCPAGNGLGSLSVALNWGFQLTLGASIGVTIAGHSILGPWTFGPYCVYSIKRSISNGCYAVGNAPTGSADLPSEGQWGLRAGPRNPGHTWAGKDNVTVSPDEAFEVGGLRPFTCNASFIDVGLQFVMVGDSNVEYYYASINMKVPVYGNCIAQTYFQLLPCDQVPGCSGSAFILLPVANSFYVMCNDVQPSYVSAWPINANISAHDTEMWLADGCIKTNVYRVSAEA